MSLTMFILLAILFILIVFIFLVLNKVLDRIERMHNGLLDHKEAIFRLRHKSNNIKICEDCGLAFGKHGSQVMIEKEEKVDSELYSLAISYKDYCHHHKKPYDKIKFVSYREDPL